jgi:hypothetical protein
MNNRDKFKALLEEMRIHAIDQYGHCIIASIIAQRLKNTRGQDAVE